MKTYHSVKELFALAEENHCSPGVIACRLESEESGKDFDEVSVSYTHLRAHET